MDISAEDVLAVHQLYGRQSHAIDSGRAADWAATFTADGEFHSPSYPEPAVGAAELTAFAERFHAGFLESGEVLHHVISTVDVTPVGSDTLTSRAYLQIVGTPTGRPSRLHRLTTVVDDIVRTPSGWRIDRRTVLRDP
ncbi:nuclear transport factor 2 family protein [Pseudonocardia sp. RS11V-5]|uniref:nuclear transport factor 2 family protein n=1 Tax=Pseudonocardia terrae TaxID=2905831 RepID=UPI001E4DE069|nr:nuclear transport factor 2 family protein [Pseudonocardia terrae]MCE3554111.1 nuclear transport factor 2 family protein [Pseudonocardia terrae]